MYWKFFCVNVPKETKISEMVTDSILQVVTVFVLPLQYCHKRTTPFTKTFSALREYRVTRASNVISSAPFF